MAAPRTVFAKTMDRVDGLLLLHPQLHGAQGRPKQHVSDILRGALVLAVAALDALVLDSVVAAIPKGLREQNLGQNVEKWLKENPDASLEIMAGGNAGEDLAEFCRGQLGVLTFQRSAMIEGVMRDTVGAAAPWQRAADLLSTEGDHWDVDRVTTKLDEIVERRHRIAHSGDMKLNGTSTRPIQVPYVREAARVIRAVGNGVTYVT